MIDNNFSGKNGFIWWVGITEDIFDPLGLGRCRIRIFGWHTMNKAELPTEKLPWAHPVYPLNNSHAFGVPKGPTSEGSDNGDWVLGFFLDGENAQMPVMLGVIPGIYRAESGITTGKV